MSNVYNNDNDKVVGFKIEEETIIDKLIHGPKERDIVLITGMGGLGKTTLARRVYNEKKVVNRFDSRAWCTISQEYDCNDLWHEIYSQVSGTKTKIDDVAEKLRKSLMGKRYLIVLDDIWSLEAWEDLNRVFPSCDNGSRIVLTSRQENVVSNGQNICLPFFTIDESWELLQMKLFKGERCPDELENIGREICNKCGGLPLVIGLVAGLLQGKSEQLWQEFLNTLNSHAAFTDGIQSNDAIELSYKHLSHHLKPCLLYFAVFPEDRNIFVPKLIQLWISEGFIDIIEKERVEEEAEDYLNHLVGSNLIMVYEREYDGRISSCVVHDLVRDFCLTKAKEENFLQIINLEKLDPTLNLNPHRICFHTYGGHEIPYELVPWDSSISTLMGFKIRNGYHDPNIYKGLRMAKNFKHLTILDLEFIDVNESILFEVHSLVHLRYLALSLNGSGFVSPLSLGNLQCLITLKLTSNEDLHLPKFFWNMTSLRHMSIHHYCFSCSEESTPITGAIPNSEVLQTLDSSSSLSMEDQHLLRQLPYLKVLKCLVPFTDPFPEIDFLHHLEYLRLHSLIGRRHLLKDLKLSKFPPRVKKIELFGITVSLSAISIIAQLSHLEALTLDCCKFEGLEWNVEEETRFRKLKYLELNDVEIRMWNMTSAESFPCLEHLILEDCVYLEEVPSALADISTLKIISLHRCRAQTSAKKIEEEARELGNEQLNVKIL